MYRTRSGISFYMLFFIVIVIPEDGILPFSVKCPASLASQDHHRSNPKRLHIWHKFAKYAVQWMWKITSFYHNFQISFA